MKSRKLFAKYERGEHWKRRPATDADRFAKFLKRRRFSGLVIDIGCGNGRDTALFDRYGFEAMGIDLSPQEIGRARRRWPRLNFRMGNVERLKFGDASADAVFVINVMHYVDQAKAIREIMRVLRPGGYACIQFNLRIADKSGKVDHVQNRQSITRLMRGFKIVNSKNLERVDELPIRHRHEILELMLMKPRRLGSA